MSKQQQLRPWAEQSIGNQNNPANPTTPSTEEATFETMAAALFRRVEVPMPFNSERVRLAVFQPRPAPRQLRPVLVAATVVLLSSAGAVAAARRIPPLTLWLMTVSATGPGRNAPTALPGETRTPPQPWGPSPSEAALSAESEAPATATEAAAPGATTVASQAPSRPNRRMKPASSPRLALAIPKREVLESVPIQPSPAGSQPANPLLGPPEAAPIPPAEEPEAESPLARETRILNQAFSQLRAKRDPGAALDTFNDYLEANPLGVMRKEASMARIEALLKLGRQRDALAALQSFPFGDGARDAEMRVVRGELAAVRSCQEAIPDFAAVTSEGAASPAVLERALYGRAACEARLGRRPEAEVSFRAYLRQFPAGSFAAGARRQLGDPARNLPAR
jgi:TolA-binding protein